MATQNKYNLVDKSHNSHILKLWEFAMAQIDISYRPYKHYIYKL